MTDGQVVRWWLGRDEAPVDPDTLRIGDLSVDVDGIDLRRLSVRGIELVNRVYVGVRDTDWNTLAPVVTNRRIDEGPDGTALTFDARHDGAGIAFRWQGRIRLTADEASYEMDGVAEHAFDHNRIGFCVLHPASQAGWTYEAVTPDGPVAGTLPARIEPQLIVDGVEQPMFPACSGLRLDGGEVSLDIAFEGDLFEMEDQRNWTDASFKTYCTPIVLGYPHHVAAGTRIRQAIRVRVRPRASGSSVATAAGSRARSTGVRLELAVPTGVSGWPAMGLGLGPDAGRALGSGPVAALAREAALDHVRLDLHLGAADWQDSLARALAGADAAEAGLEVALFGDASTAGELATAGPRLRDPRIRRVIALHEPDAGIATTPAAWLDAVQALFDRDPSAPPVFTGTDGDFAELNRDRPPADAGDGVAYSGNPQVHAADEASLLESLATHGETVRTARTITNGLVAFTPITLRGRFNPAAADPVAARLLPPPEDPRQASLFTAGWLLGSVASLVAAGADSATWFEVAGPRGVIGLPPGAHPFPAWFVLADLALRREGAPLVTPGGTGPDLTALAIDGPEVVRVLVANPTPHPRTVVVGPVPAGPARLRILDADTALGATRAPSEFRHSGAAVTVRAGEATIDLPPFGYACLDVASRRP